LPLIADIAQCSRHVRFVPRAASQQIAWLFDHLIGPGEHRRRHLEAKRLRGLEVDDQLVLGVSFLTSNVQQFRFGRPLRVSPFLVIGQ
jgi:hypothetical protein